MQRTLPRNQGFLTLEIILSVLTLGVIALAIGGLFASGQEATVLATKRNEALFLAEEGLEAVRSIRNDSFLNMEEGDHGLAQTGAQWYFLGDSDITDETFTRVVTVANDGDHARNVKVTITWQQNSQRTGTIIASTRLTNWQQEVIPEDIPEDVPEVL